MKQRATGPLARKPPAKQPELVKSQLDGRFKRYFSSGSRHSYTARRFAFASSWSSGGSRARARYRFEAGERRLERTRSHYHHGHRWPTGRDRTFIIVAPDTIGTRFINDPSISATRDRSKASSILRLPLARPLTRRYAGQTRVPCPLSIKSFDRLTSR